MIQNGQVSILKPQRSKIVNVNCLNVVKLAQKDYKATLVKKRAVSRILEHFKIIDSMDLTKNQENQEI